MNEPTSELHRLRTLHLFAGAGGGILADLLLENQPICAVEIEPYCQQVLHARQKDGILPWFPIFDDAKTFDGKPWRGLVDVVCGGFPCQDISAAGKGAGITGERSGLWKEFARVISEVRPRFAFVENSPRLTCRGLGVVLGDLAEVGYHARWGVFSCAEVGGEHVRERLFILAHTDLSQRERDECSIGIKKAHSITSNTRWGKDKPGVDRMANGVAYRVDRLKSIGNGQVPNVAAIAWEVLR